MKTQLIHGQHERIDLQLLKKKKVNLAVFGHGNVGGALLDQIADSAASITRRKDIILNVFAVTNSEKALTTSEGIKKDWRKHFNEEGTDWTLQTPIDFAQSNNLKNLLYLLLYKL